MNGDEVADRIKNVRITPVRLPEGYEMGAVDRFLDDLEATARRGGDLAALVRTAQFPKVRVREGYKIDEVDRFLAEVAAIGAVDPPAPRTRPHTPSESAWAVRTLVERARFTPVRLREGYEMADVDRLLDRVVEAAERGEPVGAVVRAAQLARVRVREGYDIAEVDRFLEQLEGVTPGAVDPGVIQEEKGIFRRLLDSL